MGLVYRIAAELGDHEYLLLNVYTGVKYQVRIDPDKILLFEQRINGHTSPEACPFLHLAPGGEKSSCTVHHSRPDVCREVFCCWLLILDTTGNRAGRVMGTRHLCPETAELEEIWETRVKRLEGADDAKWEEEVIHILTNAGYTVRR
jgi:hypothetical protein